jgi:hypothetical protein
MKRRITPPTFCGVRMTGNTNQWTVLVNEWRCYIYPSVSAGSKFYRLHLFGSMVKTGVVSGGEQACANAAERWMQSVGVDTRKLAGRRAA